MPSFHFTQYFALARVYSGIYDTYWLPYGAAGLIAVANVRGHNHWVSDMFAGAVVGTVIGEVVLRNHRKRKGQLNATFTPIATTESVGFSFTQRF